MGWQQTTYGHSRRDNTRKHTSHLGRFSHPAPFTPSSPFPRSVLFTAERKGVTASGSVLCTKMGISVIKFDGVAPLCSGERNK